MVMKQRCALEAAWLALLVFIAATSTVNNIAAGKSCSVNVQGLAHIMRFK